MPRFFWTFIRLFMLGIIAGACGLGYILYYYSKDLPDYHTLAHYDPPAATRIYSADGSLLEEYAKENRIFLPIEAIPHSLIEAFIASEDKSFYSNPGLDIMGILRASITNISRVMNDKRMEGASTITQQVVKNFLLSSERSFERKIKEAILSYMVSQTFSKDQILELYLNQIYLGKGAYGVATATKAYFNKSVDELTLAESALLAALPKAPSAFNPDTNYARALERRNYVLARMVEDGYITKEAAIAAINEPIKLAARKRDNIIKANYYSDEVRDFIIKLLGEEKFYNGGLTIITSLNSTYQNKAEQALVTALRQYDKQHGYRGRFAKISLDEWQSNLQKITPPAGLKEYQLAVVLATSHEQAKIGLKTGEVSHIPESELAWAKNKKEGIGNILKQGDVIIVEKLKTHYALRQIPEVNGGLFVMNPATGRVLAMVGGYDHDISKFNRATQAIRQPGSAIKPFIYLAALEEGIAPNTIFEDGPIELFQGPGLPLWRPRNYERNYLGPVTMRVGLEKSRNLVTVRVAQTVGLPKVMELIERLGIGSNLKPMFSMVLGSFETTLSKLTSAYATIANQGVAVKPEFVELVLDRRGKVLYHRDNRLCDTCSNQAPPVIVAPNKDPIVDPAAAYQLTNILTGVIERGTGQKAKSLGKVIAGKTGTTNESKDTWFIGYTPTISVGTYIGFDTPKSLGKKATGATVALPIFIDFMKSMGSDIPNLEFIKPDNIILKNIDRTTGIVIENGEQNSNLVSEAFRGENSEDYTPTILRPEVAAPDVFQFLDVNDSFDEDKTASEAIY